MANLLFICSKNQWRSPTAELLFKNHSRHRARSAGTSQKARIQVNTNLVQWADVIWVMENKHRQILKQRFAQELKHKPLFVMHIEDEYIYNDPELIKMLQLVLSEYL